MTASAVSAISLSAELAMGDAVARQGSTDPSSPQPGKVLVAAIATHKDRETGVLYLPGQQYYLDEARAVAGAARGVVYILGSGSMDWWKGKGRVLSPWGDDRELPYSTEAVAGSLRIVSGCGYDPGSQGYRFHSALNQFSKHASVFVRWADSNPFSSLRQYDGETDGPIVRQALLEADVIHCHINYLLLNNSGLTRRPGQLLIRHYHGSLHPQDRERIGKKSHLVDLRNEPGAKFDKILGAHLVGARLTFLQEAEEYAAEIGEEIAIDWLPITVPVQRYRKLSKKAPATSPKGAFRIAHCPTRPAIKGTKQFLEVCDRLNKKGLSIVPVLMTDLPQAEALARKRTCDACYDSDWLGLQTSGLEAGAMGQPAIAGDPDVRDLHQKHVGSCPYTFFDSRRENDLGETIERLATDREFYKAEASRLQKYVIDYHDYPAVARRYEEILAKHLKRDDVFTAGAGVQRAWHGHAITVLQEALDANSETA